MVIPAGDSYIINNGEKQCLRFSKDGKFQNVIGFYGRGANEHSYLMNIWENNGKVYLLDTKYEVLIYDLNGEHISNVSMDSYLKANVSNVYNLPNGDLVTFSPDKGPAPKNTMLVFANISESKNTFETKGSIPHINALQEAASVNWYFKEGQFVENGKQIYFKATLNDTIYSLVNNSGRYSLSPSYVFDLGKYAAIPDARVKVSKSFFASKVFQPFKQMQKIELLGITNKYIVYKDDDKNTYFYNYKNGKMNKYKLDVTPVEVNSDGYLICYNYSDDESNPQLIIGKIK